MPDDPGVELTVSAPAAATRSRRWVVLVLIFVALAVRGRAMLSMQNSLRADPDGYGELAWNIHNDWTFGYWQRGSLQPTAYRPPLYPLVLSVCDYLPEPYAAYGLFHVLLGVGTVLGVWRLGELGNLPRAVSLLAAALVAIDPILINQASLLMNETLCAFLATWMLVALARLAHAPSMGGSLLAGVLGGLCVLARPTFLVWLVLIAAAMPFLISAARRRALGLTAAFAATAAAVVAPWPLRNWSQFGVPIVTTTHGGYTLLLGNNPGFYEYLRSGAWGSVWDANSFNNQWGAEFREVLRNRDRLDVTNELSTDALAYRLAWQNIQSEPAMFAYACVVRVGRLWGVLPHQVSLNESPTQRGQRYAVTIFYAAQLSLAALGVWFLGRNLLTSPWVWGLLLAVSFTAVHTLYWTDLRMRAPLVSVIALAAAVGLAQLASKNRVVKPLAETA